MNCIQLFRVSRAARPKPLTSPKLSLLLFILGSPERSLKGQGFALPRAPDRHIELYKEKAFSSYKSKTPPVKDRWKNNFTMHSSQQPQLCFRIFLNIV